MKVEAEEHHHAPAGFVDAAVAERNKALELLAQPHSSSITGLTKPILILQQPKSDATFVDSHIEPLKSWLKVHVDKSSGSDSTKYTFYFIWTNPSEFFAVVNVESFLTLNGQWRAWADTGLFSGDQTTLTLLAEMNIRRWTGWGTDPATGKDFLGTDYPVSFDSQPTQFILQVTADGGETFSPNQPLGDSFDPERFYNLTTKWVGVPGGAVMIVEVSLGIIYGFSDGGDGNGVQVDLFYDPLDYKVRCPQVVLEINIPAEP